MTNSQRIQRIINEYRNQLLNVERMLITLHGVKYVMGLDVIRLNSAVRSQKHTRKNSIIWAAVNAVPLALGIITLNPFSIGLSGGLVIFESVLAITSHVKLKKAEKQLKKQEMIKDRTEKYFAHLESQREFLMTKIDVLEDVLSKAKASGREPSDQLVLQAMQGKTMFLLEAGSQDEYVTDEVAECIEEKCSGTTLYDDCEYDVEIE